MSNARASLNPQKTKERWLKEGINRYKAESYEESLNACNQAIRLDPHFVKAYYGKGLSLSNLGRYEEALLAYNRAIQLDPTYSKAYKGKGEVLYTLKSYSEARQAFEEAIRLDSNLESLYRDKIHFLLKEGRTLLLSHQTSEAYEFYKNAVLFGFEQSEDYIPHGRELYDEGTRLFELKLFQEALEAFEVAILVQRRALRTDDSSMYIALGETLIAKGEVLFKLKQYQEVITTYNEIQVVYRHDMQTYKVKSASLIVKARSLYKERQYLKSYAAYKRAILFDPNPRYKNEYEYKSKILLSRSQEFYELGQYEQYEAAYADAITFNPDNRSAKTNRRRLNENRGMEDRTDYFKMMTEGYLGGV